MPPTDRLGFLRSVNVGRPQTTEWHGRQVTSGIWKEPLTGPVEVRGVNLDGDEQADLRVHGGPDKAVYAYSSEDYAWWSAELGRPIEPGTFGENLTIEGVDLDEVVIGERWRVGSVVLEARQPRQPCYKLGMRMGDASFVDRFDAAQRFGVYFSIVEPGVLEAGDAIELLDRPDGIRTVQLGTATPDDEAFLSLIAATSTVPDVWRDWATRNLARNALR
jgi:MOSC domain-containing protein YiiM